MCSYAPFGLKEAFKRPVDDPVAKYKDAHEQKTFCNRIVVEVGAKGEKLLQHCQN